MKKSIITLALAALTLALPASVSAQFRYGPTLGVDVTNLTFKQDLFTVDKAVGYSAGVVGEMMFPGIGFGIDFGVFYQQRGAVMHLGDKEMWRYMGLGTERSYLHYLEIPLHLRYKYTRIEGMDEYFAPFIFAGPDFGFLVAHNKNVALDYAGGQIGISVGLGAEIYKHWQISGSYTWGTTYALRMKILTNDSARNRTWNLRVAYLF